MRQIEITPRIRSIAVLFRDELRNRPGTAYKSPRSQLDKLKSDLIEPTDQQYVQLIIDNWELLVVATPSEFPNLIARFEAIIPTEDVPGRKSRKMEDGTEKEVTLYKEIFHAMRYDFVQSTIYPKYINQLGIRTCVYCNAQYAFSVPDKNGYLCYELDHFLPKSKYPYLCTTFMNLQPSCSTCNRKKNDGEKEPDEDAFQLFVEESVAADLCPTEFHMPEANIARYLVTQDSEDLDIVFHCKGNSRLLKWFDRLFHINTLYQAHKDVAEELIWKQKIYNRIFIEVYKRQFSELKFSDVQFNRYIIGNYDREEDVHKRPLAKMTQDIAKQLHIIV